MSQAAAAAAAARGRKAARQVAAQPVPAATKPLKKQTGGSVVKTESSGATATKASGVTIAVATRPTVKASAKRTKPTRKPAPKVEDADDEVHTPENEAKTAAARTDIDDKGAQVMRVLSTLVSR